MYICFRNILFTKNKQSGNLMFKHIVHNNTHLVFRLAEV